jgi:L-2-hydroxyglutarate oxidase LhgO
LEHVDVVVIGAGVVGLAIAAEITSRLSKQQVILMERHEQFGQETSSRNSEVIHAGIYYPKDSLKARLCVEGKELLYHFCRQFRVPHSRLGKLVVAIREGDIPSLHSLMENALANGVDDLTFLSESEVRKLEPQIATKGALFSPSTGIIDSHSLMKKLEWQALQGGAMAVYRHNVKGVTAQGDEYVVEFSNPDGSNGSIKCSWLINCAGINSDHIASLFGIDVETEGYKLYPCKGEYFSVRSSKGLVTKHLIYPPPDKELKSLGIHLTRNLDGGVRLGPSAFYVTDLNYSVDQNHVGEFFNAVKEYLPFLEMKDLEPDMAGIRPKLQGPGEPFRDFLIRHESNRGLRGVINLVGIDSPGLTCCLSIARMVVNIMKE